MKLEVDTSQATVAKISLTVPADEFETQVRQGLRNVAGNVQMKASDPGRSPPRSSRSSSARGSARRSRYFVNQAYGQAVQENELKPIAHPRLAPEALELADDGSFELEFECPSSPGSTCRPTRA